MSIFLFFCYIKNMIQKYLAKYNLPEHKQAIAIALLLMAVAIMYAWYIQPPLNVDAKAHQRIALNILQGNGYWETSPPDQTFDPAIGRSGPLLEYFLAALYFIFGVHIWIVWLVQAILHGLTAWLIYKICLLIFSTQDSKKQIGLIAMILFGFYPDLIESSAMLMTETGFIFLSTWLLFLFFKYIKNPNHKTLIFFSLIAVLTFLAKSTIALPAITFIIYFIKNKQYKQFAMVSMIVILLVSPWILRNYLTFHKFIPSRTYGFYTLHNGNYHGASGENDIELLPEAIKIRDEQGIFAVEEYAKKQFFNFIKDHPIEYALLYFKKISIYFSWLRPTGHWPYLSSSQRLITFLTSGLFSVVVFSLGFSGLWKTLKQWKTNQTIKYLALFTLITPLPFIITLVETRYRYPIYPLLAIFSGYALITWQKDRQYKIFIFIFMILLFNATFDLWLNWSRFITQLPF